MGGNVRPCSRIQHSPTSGWIHRHPVRHPNAWRRIGRTAAPKRIPSIRDNGSRIRWVGQIHCCPTWDEEQSGIPAIHRGSDAVGAAVERDRAAVEPWPDPAVPTVAPGLRGSPHPGARCPPSPAASPSLPCAPAPILPAPSAAPSPSSGTRFPCGETRVWVCGTGMGVCAPPPWGREVGRGMLGFGPRG